MRDALVQPLDILGYRFESDAIVDRMLSELTQTPGALPLLQFTAAKLWEVRDESRKVLTTESYDALGGPFTGFTWICWTTPAAWWSPPTEPARWWKSPTW